MIKVLIVSANALGDTYLSCSAIEPLRKFFGDVRFSLVTIRESEIFIPFTGFDEVYYLEKRSAPELLKARKFIINILYGCYKVEYEPVFHFLMI